MSSEDSHVETIFFAVLERPEPERAAYLREMCGADTALRLRVEDLLQAQAHLQDFMETPAADGMPLADVVDAADIPASAEEPGTVIDRYTLLEVIGEGGFGVVYLASQTEPIRRLVALKIIKPGMDTKEVIARFEVERQALALMDHPNIARVLDAGTTASGRPYFAMDLVEGVGITEYCDQCNLATHQRLELFIQVCRAVQHAHHKGVIHRDLKPSNILIAMQDGRPVPKIIDFGVAKALNQRLTEQSLLTAGTEVLGTPLYMSPEQAEQRPQDVDTRSDIYSLGVLLYELLTGTTPLTKEQAKEANYDELRQLIREEQPPTPSSRISTLGATAPIVAERRRTDPRSLWQMVHGDLDWVVMKALEKDPVRRYQTANALAADVERYLDSMPVEARPPSVWYRFRKFTQRNSGVLSAAVAILMTVLIGLTASTILVVQQRNIARAQAARASAAAVRESEAADRAESAATEAHREREQALQARNVALENLYYADMHLALQDWYAGNIDRMREIVDAHVPKPEEPDLRGWEWYYLSALCHADTDTLRGHTASVNSIAMSPDGSRLASASADGTVRIWDVATGRELEDQRLREAGASFVAWLPGGNTAVATAGSGRANIWDLTTGAPRQVLDCKQHVPCMALSPSGQYLAVAVTKVGGEISTTATGRIYIWDTTSGKRVQDLVGNGAMVCSMAWSPEGHYLAVGRNWPGFVEIWEPTTWERVDYTQVHGHGVGAVAWSPDGRYLASSSNDQTISVREAGTWKTLYTISGAHRGVINALCWSGDSTQIMSGGDDGLLKIWDGATGRAVTTVPARQRPINCIVWDDQNHAFLYSGTEAWIGRCDPAVERESRTVAGREYLGWSPDGKLFAAWGPDRNPDTRTIDVFDATTGQRQFSLPNHSPGGVGLEWSPDGTRLAVNHMGVVVWDLSTREKSFHALERASPRASAWRPDGRVLAVAGLDNIVYLLDAISGTTLHELRGHTIGVTAIVWKPDGSLIASGGWTDEVKVWDPETGRLVLDLKRPHVGADGHHGVCWSPSGDRLASGCSNGEILLWDAATGEELHRLRGHTSMVRTIAWSPDGTRLASGGYDRYVKIWDPATGREMLSLPGHESSIDSIAWSPDGRQLATGDILKLRIWDASAGYQLAKEK